MSISVIYLAGDPVPLKVQLPADVIASRVDAAERGGSTWLAVPCEGNTTLDGDVIDTWSRTVMIRAAAVNVISPLPQTPVDE